MFALGLLVLNLCRIEVSSSDGEAASLMLFLIGFGYCTSGWLQQVQKIAVGATLGIEPHVAQIFSWTTGI